MFTVERLEISDSERAELERRVRAHTSSQRVARRARVILACADGMPLRQIAGVVGMDQHQVGLWRRRFLAHRLDGLKDQPRPGRPRRLGHDERLRMAAIATSERDASDPVATWTCAEVAEALRAEGIEVSVSQVWRILAAMDIGEHQGIGPFVVAQADRAHRPQPCRDIVVVDRQVEVELLGEGRIGPSLRRELRVLEGEHRAAVGAGDDDALGRVVDPIRQVEELLVEAGQGGEG